MNRNFALAAVLAAAMAGNAFASDITVDSTPFASSRSRAEVRAELAQYEQSGVNPWSMSYHQLRGAQGTKTRAEVVAEYLAARDQVAALTREDSGSAYLASARHGASTTVAAQ